LHLIRNIFGQKARVFLSPTEKFLLHPTMRSGLHVIDVPEKDIYRFLACLDVLYMTRIQHERKFTLLGGNDPTEGIPTFKLQPAHLKLMNSNAIVMHPYPRNHEIMPECDNDQRSVYHTAQPTNGLYLRMALLQTMLLEPDNLFNLPAESIAEKLIQELP